MGPRGIDLGASSDAGCTYLTLDDQTSFDAARADPMGFIPVLWRIRPRLAQLLERVAAQPVMQRAHAAESMVAPYC